MLMKVAKREQLAPGGGAQESFIGVSLLPEKWFYFLTFLCLNSQTRLEAIQT